MSYRAITYRIHVWYSYLHSADIYGEIHVGIRIYIYRERYTNLMDPMGNIGGINVI